MSLLFKTWTGLMLGLFALLALPLLVVLGIVEGFVEGIVEAFAAWWELLDRLGRNVDAEWRRLDEEEIP